MVPSLFIGHGSPYLAVTQNDYSKFLGELGKRIRPKAIVIFSAHWESQSLSYNLYRLYLRYSIKRVD